MNITEKHVNQLKDFGRVTIKDTDNENYYWYLWNEKGMISIGYGQSFKPLRCSSVLVNFNKDRAIVQNYINEMLIVARDYFKSRTQTRHMQHYYIGKDK